MSTAATLPATGGAIYLLMLSSILPTQGCCALLVKPAPD